MEILLKKISRKYFAYYHNTSYENDIEVKEMMIDMNDEKENT